MCGCVQPVQALMPFGSRPLLSDSADIEDQTRDAQDETRQERPRCVRHYRFRSRYKRFWS
jgi:hypothetical protein